MRGTATLPRKRSDDTGDEIRPEPPHRVRLDCCYRFRPKTQPLLYAMCLLKRVTDSESPHVTVVITAYDPSRYEDINEGINSILTGNYNNRDIIVVVDGRESLATRLKSHWEEHSDIIVICNDENLGAARSRNRAVERADGEVVAFFDDDAVADEQWLNELVRCYTEYDAVAAGGQMTPIWLAGQPSFLPAEFYWLIGVTYAGFPDEVTEVRNTFASNLSFRKSTFEALGGFNPDIGPKGGSLLQSAETDLCARLAEETGEQVLYNPAAKVGHKIYQYRTDPLFLLRRAFWQGVSKRGMQMYSDSSLDSESDFLRQLVSESIPARLKRVVSGERWTAALELLFLLLATASVGSGYVYGFIKFR